MKKYLAKLFRWVRNLVLLFIGLSIGVVLALRWLDPPTSSFMLQAGAQETTVRQQWVPLERISPWMQLAVIAAEDQRFPEHYGLDFKSISNAIEEHVGQGDRLRGASTITQQTAKNLFLWPGRSFVRKGLEAWFAVLVDLLWSKPRILEVYLNVAQFGRGIYGVQAAAGHYFGIPASNLSRQQAAALAAVLPNPVDYSVLAPSGYVLRHKRWILRQMDQLGKGYLGRLD